VKRFSILLAVLLFLPAAVQAEDRSVSLKEAIRLAMARHNLIKAAEYEKMATDLGVSVSRSRYLPRLYLDASFAAANAPTRVFMMKLDQGRFNENDFIINNLNHPSPTANFRTAFTLEQPLFDLGIGYGTDLAKTESEGKQLALESRREEIGYRVFTAYLAIQKARATAETAGKAVRDAREHLRLAQVRNDAGTGLKSDVLRTAAFMAEMEQQEITADNNVLLAEMRLSLTTGGSAHEPLHIREMVSGLSLELKQAELLAIALGNRKDLQETAKVMDKAGVGVKLATSAFLPTVQASATYELNDRDIPFGRDNDAWLVGANLRWELFDGTRRWSDRSRAIALQSAAREYLRQQEQELAFQVRESLLRREESKQRLEVAKAAHLAAEEGTRLIMKRYAGSLATMVEMLDAQTALNRARTTLVENEADYAQATARVWYVAGIFLKEVMK
jgi:outer membrane protein